MSFRFSVFVLFTLFFQSALCEAKGPDILPGLWEMNLEVSSKSGQFEDALAQAQQMLDSMPADQQKMVKDMMEARGINMNFGSRTLKVCMTQEQIDSFDLPKSDDGCSQEFSEQSSNHFKMTMTCPAQGMSGEGEFVVQDKKHYQGTVVMNATINGQPDTMTMNQRGTWLDSDCGDISP